MHENTTLQRKIFAASGVGALVDVRGNAGVIAVALAVMIAINANVMT